jgi:two-component system OmpR family response regulator
VTRTGKEIPLSATEYRLLHFLMRRAGRSVPNEAIIRSVWSSTDNFDRNTLHAFIKILRSKIDRGREVTMIATVRNFGYGVRDPKSM